MKRDKSQNLIGGTKSKLHTIEEYRNARRKRNSSLSSSFNESSLNALEALRSKRFQFNTRKSLEVDSFTEIKYNTNNAPNISRDRPINNI